MTFYNMSVEKWTANPLREIPDNSDERDIWFQKIDELLETTPGEDDIVAWIIRTHAAFAVFQAMNVYDLAKLHSRDCDHVIRNVGEMMSEVIPGMIPPPPYGRGRRDTTGVALMGNRYHLNIPGQNSAIICAVIDYGTSTVNGPFYTLSYMAENGAQSTYTIPAGNLEQLQPIAESLFNEDDEDEIEGISV